MAKPQNKKRASKRAVLEILKVTGKNKAELAMDIGEDAGAVRQWAMSNNREVPEEYRQRIAAAYGAEWDDDGKVFQAGDKQKRRKFTKKSFDRWRTILIFRYRNRLGYPRYRQFTTNAKGERLPLPTVKPNGEPYGKYAIEGFLIAKAEDTLSRTLAAAENRRGDDSYRRLFAVIESFLQWQDKIIKDFNLGGAKEIQDHYRESNHGILKSTGQRKFISMMKTITAPAARSDLDAVRWNGKP